MKTLINRCRLTPVRDLFQLSVIMAAVNRQGWRLVIGALMLVPLVGCTGIRWPTFAPNSAANERASAEEIYPYGDETAGPKLYAQPRHFDQPRSEATRLQQEHLRNELDERE